MNTQRFNRVSVFALTAVALIGAAALPGCTRHSYTDIQLRDPETNTAVVGQSIGRKGPLHAAYKWAITNTDGVARVKTPRDWSEFDIVVAGPGHRIEAAGTLKPGTDAWQALQPEGSATRRLEARIVAGEGAPATPKTPAEANP